MKNDLLPLALLICLVLSGCSPGVRTISPPPYPPPITKGTVMGKIMLQGRMTYEGTTVTVGELPPVTTSSDGTYTVQDVLQGQHALRAEKPGYLGAEGDLSIVGAGETKTLATVTLLAGDLNGDGTVNLFDLVLISTTYGKQDTDSLRSDLNGDGTVDLFDLVLVGGNLHQSGPIAIESP
jgi:hypothetical protein